MPIDASIPLSIQTPKFNNPFEQLGQIRQQQQQQQAQQIQLQGLQQQEQERQRVIAERKTLDAAYQGASKPGGFDRDVLSKALIDAGMGHQVPGVLKQLDDADEAREKANRAKFDTKKAQQEADIAEADYFGTLAATVKAWQYDPGATQLVLAHAKQAGHDTSEIESLLQQNPGALEQIVEGLIAKSPKQQELASSRTSSGAAALNADINKRKFETELPSITPNAAGLTPSQAAAEKRAADAAARQAAADAETRRHNRVSENAPKNEQLVQVAGPNGAATWVREADAIGKPAAQPARGVTGQERQTLAFYNRALEADKLTAGLEDSIAKMNLAQQVRLQYAPNMAQSPENQSYRQAQRTFTEARLRKESGAAIPTSEFENDAKTYFAQPGDSAAIIEQKRKARQVVLEGLAFSAGKAYEEFYGEPRQRGNAPGQTQASAAPAHRVGDVVMGPDGQKHRVEEVSPDGSKVRLGAEVVK